MMSAMKVMISQVNQTYYQIRNKVKFVLADVEGVNLERGVTYY